MFYFIGQVRIMLLIDPADFEAVLSFVRSFPALEGKTLSHVFFTHKHMDHARDSLLISNRFQIVKIIAGEEDRVPGCNFPVNDNDYVNLTWISVKCIHSPCHTRGHMLYFATDQEKSVVFTGDTLFIGGCGKFFEGTSQEMLRSLGKIKELPGNCEVYCGHEYTISNLQWAIQVDVNNEPMKQKLIWAKRQKELGKATVPSSISEELEINIFMRTHFLVRSLNCQSESETLSLLRDWKNQGKIL